MTDIEAKALALVNELFAESGGSPIDYAALFGEGDIVTLALCRAIEAHEAYKQDVSDTVENLLREYSRSFLRDYLSRFIIPKPKPDPLVEVLDAMKDGRAGPTTESYAACLRAALEARGLEIREKDQ